MSDAFAKKVVGRAYYGEETGQYSGVPVPRTIVCSISALTFTGHDSYPRINVMDWYLNFSATINAKYAGTCFPCDATRVSFYAKARAASIAHACGGTLRKCAYARLDV